MINRMRLFHSYFESVHNCLGEQPEDIVVLLDKAELHAVTEKDAAMLEFLYEVVCEFYGITRAGWEEFRQ